jgi:hypothetical protein
MFGLILMRFLMEGVLQNGDALVNRSIKIPVPTFYNFPMGPIASLGVLVNVTTCNEFYVYQFDASVPKEDREYFGYNTGSPMKSHESAGML